METRNIWDKLSTTATPSPYNWGQSPLFKCKILDNSSVMKCDCLRRTLYFSGDRNCFRAESKHTTCANSLIKVPMTAKQSPEIYEGKDSDTNNHNNKHLTSLLMLSFVARERLSSTRMSKVSMCPCTYNSTGCRPSRSTISLSDLEIWSLR